MFKFWKCQANCPYCGQAHRPPCLIEALDRELPVKATPAAPRLHESLDRTLSRIEADYASAERGRAQHAAAVDGAGE